MVGRSSAFSALRGPLGESQHVCAFGVFGALLSLAGRQPSVGIDFSLESFEELVSTWLGAGFAVGGSAP